MTLTAASSTLYWASEAMVSCWVSVTPTAAGSTRNRSTSPGASPVRASTISWEAADAKATWRLVPVMVHPSPSGTARTWTPVGPELFSGSSQAGVRMASPVTIPGSHACFWLSLPERARLAPERTELTKWGDGAMARPNSS